ncbi:MAG: DUF1127 domain-containing protein [Pseudomonadota bacterium]
MAHILQDISARSNPVSNLLQRVSDAVAQRRTYNRVLRELSAMSDRELTDINLTRGDVRRVAREAAEL